MKVTKPHTNMQPKPALVGRRTLLQGAGVLGTIGALAAGSLGLSGCAQNTPEDTGTLLAPSDENIISILATFTQSDKNPPALTEAASFNVAPYTVLTPAEGTWFGALLQGEDATPLIKAGAFSLASGSMAEIVSAPKSSGNNIVIQDVRTSDKVYAWLEVDTNTHAWTLWGAPYGAGKLTGTATQVFSADGQWEAPEFICTQDAVIFQVCPQATGAHAKEDSCVYIWRAGQGTATKAVSSKGHFASAPSASEGRIILTPRAKEDQGTFYALSTYTLADDLASCTETLILPSPIKPFAATVVGGRLCFSVEAAYEAAGVLGKMGTYLQADPNNTNAAQNFFYLGREPYANAAGNSDVLIAKNRASYLVSELSSRTYGSLYAANRSLDYGEYPLRIGTSNDFVTYASIKDASSGRPTSVLVRRFSFA